MKCPKYWYMFTMLFPEKRAWTDANGYDLFSLIKMEYFLWHASWFVSQGFGTNQEHII